VLKVDDLPPSCAIVMKSGKLNLLEPSGPVQACNGTDLPFTLYSYLQFDCLCDTPEPSTEETAYR